MAAVRLVDNGLDDRELSVLDAQFRRLRFEGYDTVGVLLSNSLTPNGGQLNMPIIKIKEELYG